MWGYEKPVREARVWMEEGGKEQLTTENGAESLCLLVSVPGALKIQAKGDLGGAIAFSNSHNYDNESDNDNYHCSVRMSQVTLQ